MHAIQFKFNQHYPGFSLTLDLTIPNNGITVVFGPSGSGKTTLLRLIAGLAKADDGFLHVNHAVWQNNETFIPAHARSVGYVFQEPRLFPHLTVMQNITFASKRSKTQHTAFALDDAIDLMAIRPLLARIPSHLSGGEKQRVAMVRALATQPQILLMDEPLASLDQALKAQMLAYIKNLSARTSIPIIYVTHALDEAEMLADYVVEIDAGQLRKMGTAEDLLPKLALQSHAMPYGKLTPDEAQLVQHFRHASAEKKRVMMANFK